MNKKFLALDMHKIFILITLFSISIASQAQSSCMAKASEKKLAGPAKTAYIKQCGKEARVVCENDDLSKKLNGSAKQNHIKKCVKDSLGS